MLLVIAEKKYIKKRATITINSFATFKRKIITFKIKHVLNCVCLLVGRNGSGKSNFFAGNIETIKKTD